MVCRVCDPLICSAPVRPTAPVPPDALEAPGVLGVPRLRRAGRSVAWEDLAKGGQGDRAGEVECGWGVVRGEAACDES